MGGNDGLTAITTAKRVKELKSDGVLNSCHVCLPSYFLPDPAIKIIETSAAINLFKVLIVIINFLADSSTVEPLGVDEKVQRAQGNSWPNNMTVDDPVSHLVGYVFFIDFESS